MLTVGGSTYEVEIENLDTSPIVVRVNGAAYEVTRPRPAAQEGGSGNIVTAPAPVTGPVATASTSSKTMVAPMPGTILEMRVKPGDRLKFGDEVGVLEAMKMKTSLRTEVAGTVAQVRVSAGQTVAHGDVLVVFE
jgi:glutaconyl-CoA decarboxylase